jgi:hypothetical protein
MNRSVQHSISNNSPRTTSQSTSLPLYTLHIPPSLNSLLFTAFSWSSLYFSSLPFPSLPFPSLHFTYHFPTPILGNTLFSPYFKIPSLHFTSLHFTSLHFTSLHFTSINTFLTVFLYMLAFPALQNAFTSLHLSHFSPFSWKYSISSSLLISFTSLHFTSLITFPNPLPKGSWFVRESP